MRISDWSSDVCSSDLNPRIRNLHGHILKFSEEGDSPLATKFSWEIFLSAGDPSLAAGGSNLVGDIDGDTFSSPDGLRTDPEGRMWVQTDHSVQIERASRRERVCQDVSISGGAGY